MHLLALPFKILMEQPANNKISLEELEVATTPPQKNMVATISVTKKLQTVIQTPSFTALTSI